MFSKCLEKPVMCMKHVKTLSAQRITTDYRSTSFAAVKVISLDTKK